jgi:2,5-diamino-6-(ribosylamino)-4(3H)-pyrimidinone 5'-phosphate reductase
MLPKVIVHNSVSLDNSLINFEVNMGLHYTIARGYKPDIHLIGSHTVRAGVELYGGKVPPEERKDFERPQKDKSMPYWVIPDTKGALKGLLHMCRGFEFCKDVILLISEETPKGYRAYLEERNYGYHVVGKKHVDLGKSLELLFKEYNAKTVLTDAGRILVNLLINQEFVSEISLLVHPVIVGYKGYTIFGGIDRTINLKLHKKERLEKGCVWLVYKVER